MIEDNLEDDFVALEAQERDMLCLAEGLGYPIRGVTPIRDERRIIKDFYNDIDGKYKP